LPEVDTRPDQSTARLHEAHRPGRAIWQPSMPPTTTWSSFVANKSHDPYTTGLFPVSAQWPWYFFSIFQFALFV
jgi:hypothetical protein